MASKRELEIPSGGLRSVVIVSDDPEFSREIADCWQEARNAPSLTVLGNSQVSGVDCESYELSLVGDVRPEALHSVLQALDSSGKPAILICEPCAKSEEYRREFPRLLLLRKHMGWPQTLVVLANEILRRTEAVNRAQRAEKINALLRCHATLGQYVIDMRHTMNNALTSVLGNAELMLLEPGAFSAGVRSQIDTIRNMALRLHEILQRFSSLEKEMIFVEKQAAKEDTSNTQAAAVGQ
jgi:signal transduction histidine kinase